MLSINFFISFAVLPWGIQQCAKLVGYSCKVNLND